MYKLVLVLALLVSAQTRATSYGPVSLESLVADSSLILMARVTVVDFSKERKRAVFAVREVVKGAREGEVVVDLSGVDARVLPLSLDVRYVLFLKPKTGTTEFVLASPIVGALQVEVTGSDQKLGSFLTDVDRSENGAFLVDVIPIYDWGTNHLVLPDELIARAKVQPFPWSNDYIDTQVVPVKRLLKWIQRQETRGISP